MLLKKWDNLPDILKNDAVKPYYDELSKRKFSLFLKRIFDIIFSILFIALFLIVYIALGVAVLIDSGFPIIYRQSRITKYGREFKVLKFRTMVNGADKSGSLVTVENDSRITKIGTFLRKYRFDELPQIFNVLMGSMSFVGTRPEVKKYVDEYSNEMMATLLLPAGVTSFTSIMFKDEAELLKNAENADKEYVEIVLPQKMKYNLKYVKNFKLVEDFKIAAKTVFAVIK